MKRPFIKASAIVVTSCALMVNTGGVISTLPTVAAASPTVANQVIKMNSTSTIILQDAQFLMQDQGRVVAYTFLISNNGNRELSLSDYWVKLRTTTGKTFATKISEQDKNIKGIAAKSSRTITYYSIVDKDTKLNEFIFDIIQWDFNVASYERKLGSIQYPNGSSVITPINTEKAMAFGSNKLSSRISQASLTQDNNNAYLQINFMLKNKGLNSLDLTKIGLFIQTDSLAVYPLDTTLFDATPLRAGEQKLYTINVTLPKGTIEQSLSLVTAIKDETNKVMLPIASLKVPASKDNTITAVNKAKQTYINGQQINTFLDSAVVGKVQNKTTINFQYALRNVGKESVNYPNMTFTLVTADGVSYPLTFKKSDDNLSKLLPQLREVISIEGTLPLNINLNKAQLLVKSGVEEKSEGYVVGAFLFDTKKQSGEIGSSYSYGNYEIKLESLQRAASTDADSIIADLVITNKGNTNTTVPSLGGFFMINGVKLNEETQKVLIDDKVTIAPGQSLNILVHSKIPYTTSINNLTFVLTDQSSSEPNNHKELYQYSSNNLNEIKTLALKDIYATKKVGTRNEIQIKRTAMYSSEEEEFFYFEFDVTNKETRAASIAELGGYLSNDDGEIVPVIFSQLTNRVRANGKVLLTGWAKVPRNFDTTEVDFIIGQKIQTAVASEAGEKAGFLIKPVKYELKFDETSDVKTSLNNISLAGFELSFNRVNATLYVTGMFDVSGVKLQMNYTLSQDKSYDHISGDHKILVEFVDQSAGKTAYSKQYAVGTATKSGDSGESVLKLAEDAPLEIIFDDKEIQSKIQKYENYVVNIYDVFQDSKILIATKELKWFQTEE